MERRCGATRVLWQNCPGAVDERSLFCLFDCDGDVLCCADCCDVNRGIDLCTRFGTRRPGRLILQSIYFPQLFLFFISCSDGITIPCLTDSPSQYQRCRHATHLTVLVVYNRSPMNCTWRSLPWWLTCSFARLNTEVYPEGLCCLRDMDVYLSFSFSSATGQ